MIARMKNPFVIYPVIFAIFPILFFYINSINQNFSSYPIVLILMAVAVVFTFAIISLLDYIIKDRQKAGLIVFIFLILFYFYGRFCDISSVDNFINTFAA